MHLNWWNRFYNQSLILNFIYFCIVSLKRCLGRDCRLECLRIPEIVLCVEFYVCKVASGVTELVVTARNFGEELPFSNHVFLFPSYLFQLFTFLEKCNWRRSLHAVIRGEKSRKEYASLLHRHKAAVIIQKRMKTVFARNRMKSINEAAVVIQSCKSFMLSKGIHICYTFSLSSVKG